MRFYRGMMQGFALLVGFAILMTLLIRFFGIETYVVLSDSMAPKIRVNDLVYIKKLDEQVPLYEGEIIAFYQNGKLVIHRIVEINGDEIITQGDNNDTKDQPISRDSVYGKYLFHVPLVGYILNIYVMLIAIGFYGIYTLSKMLYKELKGKGV